MLVDIRINHYKRHACKDQAKCSEIVITPALQAQLDQLKHARWHVPGLLPCQGFTPQTKSDESGAAAAEEEEINHIDTNEDRKLSRDEWLAKSLPEYLFGEYDLDHDGFISPEEFVKERGRDRQMAAGLAIRGEALIIHVAQSQQQARLQKRSGTDKLIKA